MFKTCLVCIIENKYVSRLKCLAYETFVIINRQSFNYLAILRTQQRDILRLHFSLSLSRFAM